MKTKAFYDELISHLQSNRFNNPVRLPTTLILGSGVSLFGGGCSKFGAIVSDTLGQDLKADPDEYLKQLELFKTFVHKLSQQERYDLFQAHLTPDLRDLENNVYGTIAELVRYGFIHFILTTNYDCCVESALYASDIPAESIQVFDLGIQCQLESDEHPQRAEYCDWLRTNLIHWDPPVKVLKLHGSFNLKSMAWTDEEFDGVFELLRQIDVLPRLLKGRIIVVGHSLTDRIVQRLLEDSTMKATPERKSEPVWFVDPNESFLKTAAVANLLPTISKRWSKQRDTYCLLEKDEGKADIFFEKLAKMLVPKRKDVPLAPFHRGNRSEKAIERYPRGVLSLWHKLDAVPYLADAIDDGLLFKWSHDGNEVVVPFHFKLPGDYDDEVKFIDRQRIRIDRQKENILDPIKEPLGADLQSLEQTFKEQYKSKLRDERNLFFRPKGHEWNETRVQFSKFYELKSGVHRFDCNGVPFLWHKATNGLLRDGVLQIVEEHPDTGRKDSALARHVVDSISDDYGEFFENVLAVNTTLGGAVGTSVLLIDDHGIGLVARRNLNLEADEGWYQLSGSGTVDYVQDAVFSGKGALEANSIDMFRSARRELVYETGLKVPLDDFFFVGWGIDLIWGHPNFLFVARYGESLAETNVENLFKVERFETDKFERLDITSGELVWDFLSSVPLSSNNAALLVMAHKWVKKQKEGHVWAGVKK